MIIHLQSVLEKKKHVDLCSTVQKKLTVAGNTCDAPQKKMLRVCDLVVLRLSVNGFKNTAKLRIPLIHITRDQTLQ